MAIKKGGSVLSKSFDAKKENISDLILTLKERKFPGSDEWLTRRQDDPAVVSD